MIPLSPTQLTLHSYITLSDPAFSGGTSATSIWQTYCNLYFLIQAVGPQIYGCEKNPLLKV